MQRSKTNRASMLMKSAVTCLSIQKEGVQKAFTTSGETFKAKGRLKVGEVVWNSTRCQLVEPAVECIFKLGS